MGIAIIIGASSGMGREFALQVSKKYQSIDEIWLVARRQDALIETAKGVEEYHKKTKIITMDITKHKSQQALVNEIEANNANVSMLIYAAGYGVMGEFTELTSQENEGMCKLHCDALVAVNHAILPFMKKNGKIMNIASSAAYLPQPGFAVYAASKAFVLSFSKALNEELKKTGITVTAVCPGPVDTEFFDGAQKYHKVKPYKKLFMAKPKKVVSKALLDSYRKKNCSTYGFSMNILHIASKLLPQELFFRFM